MSQRIIQAQKSMDDDLSRAATMQRAPLKVWEVYAGEAQLSKELQRRGVVARPFGLKTGWDFLKPSHRKKFLAMVEEQCPDHVFLSPPCTVWSQMQELARRTPQQKEQLRELRQEHHETHLAFVKDVYLLQRRHHAHIEQPAYAHSWNTRNLQSTIGHHVLFDQCELGLKFDGLPARKRTAVRTTKLALASLLGKSQCTGQHDHASLEGQNRCHRAEDYPQLMAERIADGILAEEQIDHSYVVIGDDAVNDQTIDDIYDDDDVDPTATAPDDDPTRNATFQHRKLIQEHGANVVRYVERLHRKPWPSSTECVDPDAQRSSR